MNRRIAGAAATIAVAATTAVLGAPAASAACPNEAFRTGPSALLEECRAYEQVTPVDTESGLAISDAGASFVGSSDDGIAFSSQSAYAGSQGSFIFNPYVSFRTDGSWSTRSIGATQAAGTATSNQSLLAVSPDLSHAVVSSAEALAPGAISNASNLYVRDNLTGTYALVLALPGRGYAEGWAGSSNGVPFVDAATDWSTILFVLPGGMFVFRDGQLRLVVPEAGPATYTETSPNIMSADGRSFFYLKESLYFLHRDGQEDLLVSEDEEGNPITGSETGLIGATPDANVAFFLIGETLFRFEASAPPGDRVRRVASPTGVGGETTRVSSAALGEDASTVYFVATDRLTADADPYQEGAGYLYAWRDEGGGAGQLRFVAGLGNRGGKFAVSPNGEYLGVQSSALITPDAVEGPAACPGAEFLESAGLCTNVFLYSYAGDRIACASCNGSPPVGNSALGGPARVPTANLAHSVLDEGRVLFDTPNALLTRDSNGLRDAYSWKGGQAGLISTGTSSGPSRFVDASSDGSNLYFSTEQSLVGQDRNSIVDLYDARVDGGLSQEGPPPAPECVTEAGCRRGSVAASSPAPTLGTLTARGARNVGGDCSLLRRKARAARKHSQALKRRAGRAAGRRADALRRRAADVARTEGRLARRAGSCQGVGR